MTANLYNGRAEPGALHAVLGEVNPDVLAVQELSANSAAVVAERFPRHLLYPRDDNRGMGVAVRGPAEVVTVDFPDRSLLRVTLDPTAWSLPHPVEILNAHLVNPIARPLRRSAGLRRRQVEILEEMIAAPTSGRLLVGDFNSSPAWPLYRRLRRASTDAAIAAGTACRTWGPTWWFPRLLRIDHAFVNGLIPLATHRVAIRGADHSALVVDLEIA